MMKKWGLFLFFALFLTFVSYGQDTWQVQLPYSNGCPQCVYVGMEKAADGGVVIAFNKGNSIDGIWNKYIYILKYNNNGELLWEIDEDFGIEQPLENIRGAGVSSFLINELDEIICVGGVSDGAIGEPARMFFKMDSEGDSLKLVLNTGLDSLGGYLYLLEDTVNSQYIVSSVLIGETLIASILNSDGLFEYFFPIDGLNNKKHWTINDEGHLITSWGIPIAGLYSNYFKYEIITGELLFQQSHIGDIGSLLTYNTEGKLFAHHFGLAELDDTLGIAWQAPFEDYFIAGGTFDQDPFDITPTNDGGFITAGHTGPPQLGTEFWLPYISKIDSNGAVEWGYAYNLFEIPMNYILDIEEVEDGYILVGANESSGNFWLVKITKFGETEVNSVKERKQRELAQLYPNPVKDIFTLQFPNSFRGTLNIYNSQQQLVGTQQIQNQHTIDGSVNQLPNGIYFIQIIEEQTQEVQILKLLKA